MLLFRFKKNIFKTFTKLFIYRKLVQLIFANDNKEILSSYV